MLFYLQFLIQGFVNLVFLSTLFLAHYPSQLMGWKFLLDFARTFCLFWLATFVRTCLALQPAAFTPMQRIHNPRYGMTRTGLCSKKTHKIQPSNQWSTHYCGRRIAYKGISLGGKKITAQGNEAIIGYLVFMRQGCLFSVLTGAWIQMVACASQLGVSHRNFLILGVDIDDADGSLDSDEFVSNLPA